MSRRSFGGRAVESSLRAAGFEVDNETVALVETQRPRRGSYQAVLAQNAWNVVPRAEFLDLLRHYPPSKRARIAARRLVSTVNLRRASKVVALTEYMARLCEQASGRAVECIPVVLPIDDQRSGRGSNSIVAELEQFGQFALVPGTVTWYKDPIASLKYIADVGGPMTVVFAGTYDEEECRQAVAAEATRIGLTAHFLTVAPEAMRQVYAAACMVVIPSRLESLGFALAEALAASENVAASRIPAHQEVADRLGFTIESPRPGGNIGAVIRVGRALQPDGLEQQWVRLGEALNLERIPR